MVVIVVGILFISLLLASFVWMVLNDKFDGGVDLDTKIKRFFKKSSEEKKYYKTQAYDGYCLRTFIIEAYDNDHLYHKMDRLEKKNIALFSHDISRKYDIYHIQKENLERELAEYKRNGGVIF